MPVTDLTRTDIKNLSYDALKTYLATIGEPGFRVDQIFEYLYHQETTAFAEMTRLPRALRQRLAKDFCLDGLEEEGRFCSQDKTVKLLFRLRDRQIVETVLIPTASRVTLCVSTQVGCKFGCRFCASGLGGWVRNLSPAEIVGQVLRGRREAKRQGRSLSNIVFMGIGEPLDNYEALLRAIGVMNHPRAMGIGARRMTISTCGVAPRILRLSQEGIQVELAVSLHGYDQASRGALMPVSRKYPFDELMAACREYSRRTRRRVTFEYILIERFTCRPEAAQGLARAFEGILCQVNLIPYNPVREFTYRRPGARDISAFQEALDREGIAWTMRRPRGQDVGAACGQLRRQQQGECL